jgi:hypothetical protein
VSGVASAEARASAALGGLSGPDTLLVGGALLYLVVGEILLGLLFTNGGISLGGVLAGEVLFFAWFLRPRGGRPTLHSGGVVQAVIAAFVLAIVLFAVGDLITTLKNLSSWTAAGLVPILVDLCRWVGAAAMGLGIVSAWMPGTTGAATPGAAPRV